MLPISNHPDDVFIALKGMYDIYGVCAGRLIDLVQWGERRHGD